MAVKIFPIHHLAVICGMEEKARCHAFRAAHSQNQTDKTPKKMKTPTTFIAALCAALTFAFTATADDAAIPGMKKTPAAAAEALKKYAAEAGMKIEKVAVEKHGKVTVYEAELKADGKADREVAVTADGKVKGEEETVPLDKVPEAARKAIEANAKGAKVERVQRIKEDGAITFEAAYVLKGKTTEVVFFADGKIKPEEK